MDRARQTTTGVYTNKVKPLEAWTEFLTEAVECRMLNLYGADRNSFPWSKKRSLEFGSYVDWYRIPSIFTTVQ